MTRSARSPVPDPDAPRTLSLRTGSEAETAAFATTLAGALRPGDILALEGPLGAGKSVLARAIVRAWLDDPEAPVPSPSYTLVNVYETPKGALWHADLYRISDPEELAELGLADATAWALVLIEWPGRWAALPEAALSMTLAPVGAAQRLITLTATAPRWTPLLDRLERA